MTWLHKVLLLLMSLSLFALVSCFVLLIWYSAILLLSRTCGIKPSISVKVQRMLKTRLNNKQWCIATTRRLLWKIISKMPVFVSDKDGWLGFNGILSTRVAAISCLKMSLIRKQITQYSVTHQLNDTDCYYLNVEVDRETHRPRLCSKHCMNGFHCDTRQHLNNSRQQSHLHMPVVTTSAWICIPTQSTALPV